MGACGAAGAARARPSWTVCNLRGVEPGAALPSRGVWGVGARGGWAERALVALEGAPALVDRLAAAGKKLGILSNSSKRKLWSLKELPKMGFAAEHFEPAELNETRELHRPRRALEHREQQRLTLGRSGLGAQLQEALHQ